ncbi:FmdB family zinc ribbon protein [Tautonia sociabilis]|uniref:Zinc ribbon domain-containing protein n=1 Tax=Tautonia sociabilis TaxID=2080755 RepID=A0A432MEE8_9BACT|nr:zinc ribbon domain-containing protein [Tautonia sociabilis]RUL83668.1 zinc ribbon domain-containing protein [Tautonia sociabilis]
MPLYEYRCDSCGRDFEALVRGSSDRPTCPSCGAQALTKQFSVPAAARAGSSPGPSLPVCDSPASGGCGAMGCGGGFCAMDN